VAPVPGVPDRFATHGRALDSLLRQLRNNPRLAVLDAQFHPAWSDLVQAIYDPDDPAPPSTLERHTRLPEPEDFRACFYFCQELIRLMEVVYHDLALEHAWDHPDNRGWLNAFRHWSWAPMFRIAWVVGAPMLGARFVAFCQQRLALPRLDNEAEDHRRVLRLERHAPAAGEDWRAMCDRLRARGAINHVEHSILLSDPLCAHAVRPGHVYLLRLKWAAVLGEAGGSADTTLGVAALAEDTLRLLRIQDHVRRLGLASEFMRLLINRQAISAVDIRGGYYGVGGVCRNRVAARLQRWLLDVLAQARRRQRARRDAVNAARAARRAGRPEPLGA
jgi:hypothetical protein